MGRRVQYGASFVSLPVGFGNTPPDPAIQGALFYNSDTRTLNIYDGDGWHSIRDMHAIEINSNTNLLVNKHYWVDTDPNAGFTVTLPANPTKYDKITISDKNNSISDIKPLNIDANGKNIMGDGSDPIMIVTTPGASFTLVFFDDVEGWRIEHI